jgi:Zn-dependent membrane protease YugP
MTGEKVRHVLFPRAFPLAFLLRFLIKILFRIVGFLACLFFLFFAAATVFALERLDTHHDSSRRQEAALDSLRFA